MTRFGWSIVLAALAVVVLVGGFFIWRHTRVTESAPSSQATTTPSVNPSTLSIYTSGEYGFSLFYPSTAAVTDAYSTTTLAGISWRAGAPGPGTPIVRLQSDEEEVRVGLSTDAKDKAACISAGPAEKGTGTFTVGSTIWHTFTFQKLGTDDEQQVTSYRIVRNSSCYALELFQPLAGSASSTGYTLKDTITSFSFAS